MRRLGDILPVPLAAPETPLMRKSRRRLALACALLAVLMSCPGALRALLGPLALSLIAANTAFLLVEGRSWLRVKNAADNAWLFREGGCDD